MNNENAYPDGFTYHLDIMTTDEEAALLSAIEGIERAPLIMYGRPTKRRIASFGLAYIPGRDVLAPTDPIPPAFFGARDRAAACAGVDAAMLTQALVTEYPAKASIGMHVDNPSFGDIICGVSLAGGARLTLEHGDGRSTFIVAPRSLYILQGIGRRYRHALTATAHRYSITFRTVAAHIAQRIAAS